MKYPETPVEVDIHKVEIYRNQHIAEVPSTTFKEYKTEHPMMTSTQFMHAYALKGEESRDTSCLKAVYLNRPRKLLVRDQSTRPTQLPMKKGRDIHEGWLIPTTSWTAGSSKQQAFLIRVPFTRKGKENISTNTCVVVYHYYNTAQ